MKKTSTILFALLFAVASFGQTPVLLTIPNVDFETNETVHADFYASNFVGIGAMQFAFRHNTEALEYVLQQQEFRKQWRVSGLPGFYSENEKQRLLGRDTLQAKEQSAVLSPSPLEFTGAIPSLDDDSFSWFGKPGYINLPGELRCVWSYPYGYTIADNTHIFSVVFTAKTAGNLASEFWAWTDHPVLTPRAYQTIPLASVGLDIAYTDESVATNEQPVATGFSVYPNPAKDGQTSLRFATEGGDVQINLFDMSGKLLQSLRVNYQAGEQTVRIMGLESGGLYVLQIVTPGGIRSCKIIAE